MFFLVLHFWLSCPDFVVKMRVRQCILVLFILNVFASGDVLGQKVNKFKDWTKKQRSSQDEIVVQQYVGWISALAPGVGSVPSVYNFIDEVFDPVSTGQLYYGIVNYHTDTQNSAVDVKCETKAFGSDKVGLTLNYTLNYLDAVILRSEPPLNTNIVCAATLGVVTKTFAVQVYLSSTYQQIKLFRLSQNLDTIEIPWMYYG